MEYTYIHMFYVQPFVALKIILKYIMHMVEYIETVYTV